MKEHWEGVYTRRKPDELSWFQEEPSVSLGLIEAAAPRRRAVIIDVGGGASRLVDGLLALGYVDLTVLDISAQALAYARERLLQRAESVRWIEADATTFVPDRRYDLWHDRAVFHFLAEAGARQAYLGALRQGLKVGGSLVLAAFAPDGPESCSGLPVLRFGRDEIAAELGTDFEWVSQVAETHRTPWGTAQPFNYFRFLKRR
jgi:SAM-dependent methyltransferase